MSPSLVRTVAAVALAVAPFALADPSLSESIDARASLFAAAADSQATARFTRVAIIGSVVDAGLAPIAGVTIVLEAAGRQVMTTSTDAKGAFRFANVAVGTYRIRAERSGLPSFAREVRVTGSSDTLQFPIVMTKEPVVAAADSTSAPAASRSAGTTAPPPPPAMPATVPPAQTQTSSGERSVNVGGRGGVAGGVPGGIVGGVVGGIAPPPRPGSASESYWSGRREQEPGDRYARVDPNNFHSTRTDPLSTFGADVDTASYTNVRRMLSSGQRPPSDAVRVEEFVNYFRFPFAPPSGNAPLAITTEIGDCPWAPTHKLVLIGARARTTSPRDIEGRNIVLLVDVSGSMSPQDRLPMIKTALSMFVETLSADDRIAIVTYAGSSGLALASTPGNQRDVIRRAIDRLGASGSTNGAQGLILAYRIARDAFMPGGVNRVILATDGDFNVGVTSQDALVQLIEREKASGVFLSVFGVGTGNLNDAMMEKIADRGNGNYSYLDSIQEARRVLLHEANATLETVAKDVKFQVEFNPALVASWKQIGYENRALAAEDFNDDRKDGGEMGAGHSVTALYEIVPVGADRGDDPSDDRRPAVDPLKYQEAASPRPASAVAPRASTNGEWLTVKARYKTADGDQSALISRSLTSGGRPVWLPMAASVAEFGLLLRDRPNDVARWDALERRIAQTVAPAPISADAREFAELVAVGRGLALTRR